MACVSASVRTRAPCVAPSSKTSSGFGSSESVRIPYSLRPWVCRVFASNGDNNVKVQQAPSPANGSSSVQKPPQRGTATVRRQGAPLSPLDLWDPFMPASRTFGQMMDVMNQMIDSSSNPVGPAVQRRSTGRLPWDVMEDEESFMLRVDMPGLTKDEVKVSVVDGGFLLIKGETSSERRDGEKWASRSAASYESRVVIPENAEVEKIKAELKDGVLYVTVPKKVESKKPVEIQVS